jgi:photosystem II stability/assembly factor-like uncharacterized protein
MSHSSHIPFKLFFLFILSALVIGFFPIAPVNAAVTSTSTPTPDFPEFSPKAASVPQPAAAPRFKPGDGVKLDLIKMITRTEGWGLSRQSVVTTVDGGQTWREGTPPETLPLGSEVTAYGAFLDARTAWIIYATEGQINPNASVWHTTDSGRTWTPGAPLNHTAYGDKVWAEYAVLDANNLWLMVRGVYVGAGTHHDDQLFHSADGGFTWTAFDSQLFDDYTGMVFADKNFGLRTMQTVGAYAEAPAAYQFTTDGGATWQLRDLPFPPGSPDLFTRFPYCETYQPVVLSPTSIRLLVGCFDYYDPPKQFTGYFYSSNDGGKSWLTSPLPVKVLAENSPLIYFDASHILLLGRNSYRSADGGKSWTFIKSVNWDGQFSFSDPQNGWAVARSNGEIALVKTVNGGGTWKIIEPVIAR